MSYTCSTCKRTFDLTTSLSFCPCGGLFTLGPSEDDFEKRRSDSLWRYESLLMGFTRKKKLSLGEGNTPLIRDDRGNLLKLEYLNPTLSFKDRGSVMVMSRLHHSGVKQCLIDSSGNAAISMAAYAKRSGIGIHVFVAENLSAEKRRMLSAYGADIHFVPGNRSDVSQAAFKYHETRGIPFASHVYDPLFYHGVKTYYYEIQRRLKKLPTILIPVGNGTLLFGFHLAVEEMLKRRLISKAPRLIIAQAKNCSALTGEGCESTLAEGIAVGEPKRLAEMKKLISKYQASVITITEEEILMAYTKLLEQGIYAEYTAALTYGASLLTEEHHVLPICSTGLKNHEGRP